ncbi:cell envelope integrity protein TolA [Vibrio makurazakiensis]|uniref:cell envelope integrity protein TolA n=1 Tax=Vibrio makurazakiensis TaxID=2910250 RepID=UPI003D0B55D3
MKVVRWFFLSFLFIPMVSFSSSQTEQEQMAALNKLFEGLETYTDTEYSVTSRYASMYQYLIKEKLGEFNLNKGLDCRAEISLSSLGVIEHVELSNKNMLCQTVFNAVWEIDSFPLPVDVKEADKLRKFSIVIQP